MQMLSDSGTLFKKVLVEKDFHFLVECKSRRMQFYGEYIIFINSYYCYCFVVINCSHFKNENTTVSTTA